MTYFQFVKDGLISKDDIFHTHDQLSIHCYNSLHEELWQGASPIWPDILQVSSALQ